MSYFKKLDAKIEKLYSLLNKEDKWLIIITADPDALSSALALKRILLPKVQAVDIAKTNTITRPDNLAMLKLLRIIVRDLDKVDLKQYQKFATVDAQPSHSPLFQDIDFSIVLDHHPSKVDDLEYYKTCNGLIDVRANYGSTASLLTEYLYNLKIRPSKFLATALQYGIRTDTHNFERNYLETDMRAFHFLAKFADSKLISTISHSEYLPEWLKYFSLAFNSLNTCLNGYYAYPGHVVNPDILVVVADFFLRVHGLRWIAVCGVYQDKVVTIFRGDGKSLDLGKLATLTMQDIGSGGGHKNMARAECTIEATKAGNPEIFMYKRILDSAKKLRSNKKQDKLIVAQENMAKLEKTENKN